MTLEIREKGSDAFYREVIGVSANYRYLLKNHQFLIRDASNFVGLKDCHFRIATQHPDYNDELVAAIYTFTRMKHG